MRVVPVDADTSVEDACEVWFHYIESESKYFVNGEEIIDDQHYILGTVDMYTFGRYFPSLKEQSIEYILPEFLRDIFKQKLLQY